MLLIIKLSNHQAIRKIKKPMILALNRYLNSVKYLIKSSLFSEFKNKNLIFGFKLDFIPIIIAFE